MLEELVRSGKLKLPEDKEERNMYWKVKIILERKMDITIRRYQTLQKRI